MTYQGESFTRETFLEHSRAEGSAYTKANIDAQKLLLALEGLNEEVSVDCGDLAAIEGLAIARSEEVIRTSLRLDICC